MLPTLVIHISPDPATDKLRKRRSSRTAGLTSTKDSQPTTLWFRPGDDKYSLQDWAAFIQPLIQPNMPDRPPISPMSPVSPSFINPFSSRRDISDTSQRPSSGHTNPWGPLYHKSSNNTQSSRERPLTFSETPSLRSKGSGISSSHGSSVAPGPMLYQNYTRQPSYAADLPSPATTMGEYHGEFIEGWTSAQGRSSTLSSPTGGRDSIGSQGPQSIAVTMESSSPPIPRETILDRAFQLRCIPGSERGIPGEEKLSSLARFDALMREADEKRKKREAEEARLRAESEQKSAWDLDDDSDSEDVEEEDDDDSDDVVGELNGSEHGFPIPPTAQRALNYIASRHGSPQGQRSRAQTGGGPPNYNAETLMALSSGSNLLRPQTSYTRNRPGMTQRTHSQPQLAAMAPLPGSSESPLPPAGVTVQEDGTLAARPSPLYRSQTEQRLSTSSAKRGSFTEFTKRLSSTSSLLLVQTNASSTSGASSRGSTDTAGEGSQHHGLRGPRGLRSPTPRADRDSTEKPCNWRGSVGVFGEGGFM